MNRPIRILIADDHAIVREGMKTLIALKKNMTVVGEAVDGVQAVEQARLLQPDVILLDLVMPRQDGLVALRAITRENPKSRILVLTSFGEDEQVWSAINGGALGYLLKESSPQRLMQAIEDVYRGESSLHPKIARKLMGQFQQLPQETPATKLTKREVEVLKLVAEGLSNEQIGELLSVSKGTVGKHISNILEKLHLANRTQAALYALRQGLVSLYPK
ncbi:MAG: response regulator [Ardenticatenaceae bacterium]